MHIGLFDPEWRGHHTPYASLLSEALLDSGHRATLFTAPNHPHKDVFPEDDRFTLVELDTPTVKEGTIVYTKKIRDQWAKTKQLSETIAHGQAEDINLIHILCLDFMHIPVLLNDLFGSDLPPIVASVHRDIPFDQNYETDGLRSKVRGVAENVLMWTNEYAQSLCLQWGTIQQQIVHAERIRKRIIRRISGSDPVNTTTIPAPTPSVTAPSQNEARDVLDLPNDVPLLLFFGELRYDKGPDLLVKATDGINSPLCVVFAGKEAYFDSTDIEEWTASVETSAEFETRLKYIPEEHVDTYFTAADALVLPYRRQYGISGPLRRAVMAGTPVIGSDGSDIGSVIERHDLGYTFERGNDESLGDTIRAFLDDRSGTPPEGIQQRSQEIHWRSVGSKLEDLYQGLEVHQ